MKIFKSIAKIYTFIAGFRILMNIMQGKGAYIFIIFFMAFGDLLAQQAIRGKVLDVESKNFLIAATITLYKDSSIISQTSTDLQGNFRLTNVNIGQYNLKASYLGYDPKILSNVYVNSAKETILNFELEQSTSSINAVEVHGSKKGQLDWPSGSAKEFSVEETNRFAGSRSDPARMVSNYAGVQGSDDSRNDIVIRGNSPLGMLWRYEGIDIPNPNHFAIIGNTGGPLSILNSKVLDNSEFYTGAFPADYGNTVAGAFNLKMRNGNNERNEFTGQVGLLGLELGLEGPISKKTGASFLATYRYSTLKLFESLKIPIGTDAVPNYQDMSLKLNFPFKSGGSISLFSIGGISSVNTIVSTYKNPEAELYVQKDRDQYFSAGMNTTGLSIIKPVNSSTYFKATIGWSTSRSFDHDHLVYRDSLFYVDSIVKKLGYRYIEDRISGNAFVNKKINSHIAVQSGLQFTRYHFIMIDSTYNLKTYEFDNQINYNGSTYLFQPYLLLKYKLADHLILNGGIHGQYLTLNGSKSLEPRLSVRWNLGQKHSFTVSAGMHSQMQPAYNYFYHLPGTTANELHNKNMGFTRSNHYVVSYDYFISQTIKFKTEIYYQNLYDVPVEVVPSSFSLLNQGIGSKRFYPNKLMNTGTGENYGIEFTLEKFFLRDYYFLIASSIYNSTYKGSDGINRSTDFNGSYAINILAGKKIRISDRKNLELGIKATNAGGRRYTPIDEATSKVVHEDIYVDSLRNTLRFNPYSRLDIKVGYRVNTKHLTHEIGLDLVNILNTKNIFSITYSTTSNSTIENYQLGFLPIFYYKIDF
jgi:hypothetical protein